MSACANCLAHSWLLGRLAGHLDRVRAQIHAVLALDAEALIDAVGGSRAGAVRRELAALDPAELRAGARAAGLEPVCRCDPAYPAALRELGDPPALLHVAGGVDRLARLTIGQPVAIVGARKPSPYGTELARSIAAGLAAAGVPVISGMALGIDCAAHAGALELDGSTLTVLPSGADRPYPPSKRALYRRIVAQGVAVSELPPGSASRRWTFPARNRIIAALAAATIVVEAGERSGALLTAGLARSLGRPLGAVPGRVGTAQAAGPNALLAAGAAVIRGPQDVLDLLYGAGARTVPARPRGRLDPELERLRGAIADGHDSAAALARAGIAPERGLVALAALELGGHIRRDPGGRFSVIG